MCARSSPATPMIWWRASGRAGGKKAEPRRKGADPSVWSTGLLLRHAELVSASMARHLLRRCVRFKGRSEEHTSELQSLMRSSYAVFCLKKKTTVTPHTDHHTA